MYFCFVKRNQLENYSINKVRNKELDRSKTATFYNPLEVERNWLGPACGEEFQIMQAEVGSSPDLIT